jgi:hypothetical protein
MTTSEPRNSMPIACRPQALTKAEHERSQRLRAELAAATRKTTPLADGYELEYAPDAALFREAAEWISLERRCCPFLAFGLRWAQGDETPPRLSITGPDGTKDFLAAEMPELPHGG